ncbi:MAG: NUDIX hydrolase [Dehalococcoidia bacterium]|nr:MAG: NUDIX hydrolase [Dehalococcoidia bacterium]
MSEERTLQSEYIYRGRLVNLRLDTVELPSGKQRKREIVEHRACSAIVALDSENNVLLVKQYRKPVDRELLEIPAGGVDSGEDPIGAARRELEEETGFSAESWDQLSVFYSSPGFCNEEIYVYLARGLSPTKREADDDENIELIRVPLNKILNLIESGDIYDAKSIAGLLLAVSYLK